MSAPVLWIILPLLIGCFALLLLDERITSLTGGFTCLALALIALSVPIDEAMRLGPISIKIASSASFLGRSLVLPPADAPLLAMLFGLCALWFIGARAAGVAIRLVPLGLVIVALLVASIAVQPFLYASLLIEMAVIAAVPLLAPLGQQPGPGVLRFLTYQTLGMPFILFAGWLLAGVETSPGDLSLTIQSTVMLGLGFAFLLAIFPLNDWMPRLMEDCNPYIGGFLLWLLPNMIVILAMSFLDRYAWLRTSPEVTLGLRAIGLLMLVSGALASAFEKHLARALSHAAIAQTGFLILALSLIVRSNSDYVTAFLIPRGIGLATWAMALSILKNGEAVTDFPTGRGAARHYPWASAAIVLASLSTAGLPLLAGFPPGLALWAGLAHDSTAAAVWYFVGLLALLVGGVRQMSVLFVPGEGVPQAARESLVQRTMLGTGMFGLLLLGFFPQATDFIVAKLPLMFQHLAK